MPTPSLSAWRTTVRLYGYEVESSGRRQRWPRTTNLSSSHKRTMARSACGNRRMSWSSSFSRSASRSSVRARCWAISMTTWSLSAGSLPYTLWVMVSALSCSRMTRLVSVVAGVGAGRKAKRYGPTWSVSRSVNGIGRWGVRRWPLREVPLLLSRSSTR